MSDFEGYSDEQLDELLAQRESDSAEKLKEQRAADWRAVKILKLKHGPENIRVLELPRFIPGLPSLVALRTPTDAEHRRLVSQAKSAGEDQEMLKEANLVYGRTTWVYPAKEDEASRKKLVESFTDSLVNAIANEAVKLVGARAKAEGKG